MIRITLNVPEEQATEVLRKYSRELGELETPYGVEELPEVAAAFFEQYAIHSDFYLFPELHQDID